MIFLSDRLSQHSHDLYTQIWSQITTVWLASSHFIIIIFFPNNNHLITSVCIYNIHTRKRIGFFYRLNFPRTLSIYIYIYTRKTRRIKFSQRCLSRKTRSYKSRGTLRVKSVEDADSKDSLRLRRNVHIYTHMKKINTLMTLLIFWFIKRKYNFYPENLN